MKSYHAMIISLLWFLIMRSDEDRHNSGAAMMSGVFGLGFMIGALVKMFREP